MDPYISRLLILKIGKYIWWNQTHKGKAFWKAFMHFCLNEFETRKDFTFCRVSCSF